MSFYDALFWVFAAVAVAPAVMVLVSKDIVRMAFWLLASLAGFAGLYLHLGADFLGFAQIIVYVGGILILFLFGVMLTYRQDVAVRRRVPWTVLVPGVAVGILVSAMLIAVVVLQPWAERASGELPSLGPRGAGAALESPPVASSTASDIGVQFLSTYILPFEAVSVLLVVAMVGAAYIARSREESNESDSKAETEVRR